MASTKVRIAGAVKELASSKQLEKITVEDIIQKAEISRQTFYKYFRDKYDVVFFIYQEANKAAVEKSYQESDHKQMAIAMLENYKSDIKFYRNVYNDHTSQNSFYSQLWHECVNIWINRIGKSRMNDDLKKLIEFYAFGSCNTMKKWIMNGAVEPVEFMQDVLYRAIPDELQEYFKSST